MATPEIASTELEHYYHAQAYVLDAALEHPVREKTGRQAQVDLPADGKYQFQPAKPFQLFGVLSYRSGYTQVAGHKSPKQGHGHVTLATSVVEDLNVFDIVTADRVVGQISTEHPRDGEVPHVTFLGTRFVNLRIGGHKVEVEQDLNILGPKPRKDKSYLDDAGVLSRISQQHTNIRKTKELPEWAQDHFRKGKLGKNGNEASCSLVKRITGAPGIAFGHVIDLPNFGKIFLAELTLLREPAPNRDERTAYHFRLTMIRLEMGCIGTGTANIVAMDSNGKGKGGGG